ncbi:MAG: MBL fold metallo-hydrolase [Candidatus Eisenbacteria bacterium]|nr:MBL fold metallo-hydrolase [Candidatus Eisenbacteria bacterium]
MIIEVLPVGALQCNCVVLGDPESRSALIIDPGDEAGKILDLLERRGWRAQMIFQTHAHLDHVGATGEVQRAVECDVALHPGDRFLHENLETQAQWLGVPPPPAVPWTVELEAGQSISVGPHTGKVLHTPGHSPGSVCLYFPDAVPTEESEESRDRRPLLVAGDLLFMGSIGRTDLWGGSMDELTRSLHEQILPLPDETFVLPGHGPATTMANEKRWNPFLRT